LPYKPLFELGWRSLKRSLASILCRLWAAETGLKIGSPTQDCQNSSLLAEMNGKVARLLGKVHVRLSIGKFSWMDLIQVDLGCSQQLKFLFVARHSVTTSFVYVGCSDGGKMSPL
jgi:hypothetical protein